MRKPSQLVILAAACLLLLALIVVEARAAADDAQRMANASALPVAEPTITLPLPGEEY